MRKKFAHLYVQLNDATEAAKQAGYVGTPYSMKTMVSRLLKHPDVVEEIDSVLKPVLEQTKKSLTEALSIPGASPMDIVKRMVKKALTSEDENIQVRADENLAEYNGMKKLIMEQKAELVYKQLVSGPYAETPIETPPQA